MSSQVMSTVLSVLSNAITRKVAICKVLSIVVALLCNEWAQKTHIQGLGRKNGHLIKCRGAEKIVGQS